MIDFQSNYSVTENNKNSLEMLKRAISLSQGRFLLIFLHCNYEFLQNKVLQQLKELSQVDIQELVLHKSDDDLYGAIEAKIKCQQPPALMVSEMTSVAALDDLLISINGAREKFRDFKFPLIILVNYKVLQKLVKLAPDFNDWAIKTQIDITTDELIKFIRETADKVFSEVLKAGANIIFLGKAALNLDLDFQDYIEVESAYSALRDLRSRGVIDPELEVGIEFILGLISDRLTEESRGHYQRSLEMWRESQSHNLEWGGCIQYYLGLWWLNKAVRVRYKDEYSAPLQIVEFLKFY